MSEGHSAARQYPLAVLWSEARFARQRINERMATEVALTHAAIVDVLCGKSHLDEALKRLKNGD